MVKGAVRLINKPSSYLEHRRRRLGHSTGEARQPDGKSRLSFLRPGLGAIIVVIRPIVHHISRVYPLKRNRCGGLQRGLVGANHRPITWQ